MGRVTSSQGLGKMPTPAVVPRSLLPLGSASVAMTILPLEMSFAKACSFLALWWTSAKQTISYCLHSSLTHPTTASEPKVMLAKAMEMEGFALLEEPNPPPRWGGLFFL